MYSFRNPFTILWLANILFTTLACNKTAPIENTNINRPTTTNGLIPVINNLSPSKGAIGTLLTIAGTGLTATTTVTIGATPALLLSSSDTVLKYLVMPGTTTDTVKVNTSHGAAAAGIFQVLPTGYPSAQQSKVSGTGGITGNCGQGISVALSADGNTAAIGGWLNTSLEGGVWIFTRSNGTWTQEGGKLLGTGAIGKAYQGYAVAINALGNRLLVGGYADNSLNGAVWVFNKIAGNWVQETNKLIGTGNVGAAKQGYALALSADGNTAIIGGPGDNNNQGAAWIFKRSGSSWTQVGNKLVGTGGVGTSQQGYAVAFSADASTAVVTGARDDGGIGAAWVFADNNGTWTQQGNKLVGTGYQYRFPAQGTSAALNADGNTLIVGATDENNGVGASWIYVRSAGVWSQQGSKLIGVPYGLGYPYQGSSVSLSADGNTALIGALQDNPDRVSFGAKGATWIFRRNNNVWTQQGNKLVGTGNIGQAFQGQSVALTPDATTAFIGGWYDNSLRGAGWVFIQP